MIVSTANGLKFTDFKLRYHESTLPMPSHFANRPVQVDDDYDQVRRVIDGGGGDRALRPRPICGTMTR